MAEYSSQTGQVKKITLPSSIEQVMWSKKLAVVGGLVELEVFTLYIGNNSEIQIELSDASGKTLGRYTERMAGSRFRAPIRVPAEAQQELFATVKLPKHGLQKKSPPLLVVPPIQITNTRWDKSEARRGDTLKLTAELKGVPDGVDVLIQIYEHDADGAHELITKMPATVKNKKIEAEWEYQYTGNTKEIPTAQETEKGYHPPQFFFRVSAGEVSADSGLLEFKDWIEIELHDRRGNPMGGAEYVLHLPDGTQKRGKLSAGGTAIERGIPPGPCQLEFPGIDGPVSLATNEEAHG